MSSLLTSPQKNTVKSEYINTEINNIKKYYPDWLGRIGNRKSFYDLIKNERYNPLIKSYSSAEIENFILYINEVSLNKNYTKSQLLFLKNRYARYEELPVEVYALTAMVICSGESKRTRMNKLLEVFEATYLGYISLATPILLNARFVLSDKTSISSCFISNAEDNIESFGRTINDTMQVLTHAGGMGICVDEIRAKGSDLRGLKGKAKGVKNSLLTIINSVANSIDQGGLRKGNVTVAIGIHHKDCLDVINARREFGSEIEDARTNISDLFPQIIVSDLFMERCESKDGWYTFDPYETNRFGINLNKVYGEEYRQQYLNLEELAKQGKISFNYYDNARDLMKSIILSYIETGFPYLFYKDNANKYNIIEEDGYVVLCGNLCMESFTQTKHTTHVCTLSSVNVFLANTKDKRVKYAKLACRILNNLVLLFNNKNPLQTVRMHNDFIRPIGVGILGYHDFLVDLGYKYSDSQAKVLAGQVMEDIAYGALSESVTLAKLMPTKVFKDFENSTWSKGLIFSKPLSWYRENSYDYERWEIIKEEISVNKLFNGYLISIAPTTSSANLTGVTQSWFPRMNIEIEYKSLVGSVTIYPPTKRELWQFYELDYKIDQNHKIQIAKKLQDWTDQGVSFELTFSLEEGAYDKKLPPKIYEWFVNAWKEGIKAFYYGTSKVASTSSEKTISCSLDKCESCSG